MTGSMGEVFSRVSYLMALFLGLVFTGVYYNSFYDDGSALEAQIASQRSVIAAESDKKKNTDKILAEEVAIKSEVGALGEKFKEITSRFPVNLKSDELVAVMNTLAKRSSVRIVSARKNPSAKRELYEEIPLSLQLQGSFNNLVQFMYHIVILEKVTNVIRFDFSNLQEKYDGSLRLNIQVVGYKYRMSSNAQLQPPKNSTFEFYVWQWNHGQSLLRGPADREGIIEKILGGAEG